MQSLASGSFNSMRSFTLQGGRSQQHKAYYAHPASVLALAPDRVGAAESRAK